MMSFARNKLGACIAGFAVLCSASMLAEHALANSSSFSWRMDKRYISGKDNGRFHVLDGGTVTIQRHIEVTERLRGSVSTPISVDIRLIHVEFTPENPACKVTVTPDTAVGAKKAFSAQCGNIKAGKYWLLIKKNTEMNPDGDGWHNRGTGSVSTL